MLQSHFCDFSGKLFERATNEAAGADAMNNHFTGEQSFARLSVALPIVIQRFGIQRIVAPIFVTPPVASLVDTSLVVISL